jgi:hypothetical protein
MATDATFFGYGILTDLFSNMHRNGLFTKLEEDEKERERQHRVLTYIRKFEATYGPLAQKDLERIKTDANLHRVLPKIYILNYLFRVTRTTWLTSWFLRYQLMK